MNKHNGFTLIELMVVVGIVAVMGAVAIPVYSGYMEKSKYYDAKAKLAELADKEERFYLQNNTYTATIGTGGLNTTATSNEGGFTYEIVASASGLVAGFVATATRKVDTVIDCKVLTLSSSGVRTSEDSTGADSTAKCWKRS